MRTIPSGTVAFLFTDIEGSTRLWEAHPEEMKTAVARHDAICRATIEGQGGYVFKTVGDAFCATFFRVPDAVAAAASIRRELAAVDWGRTPIKVRAGIHTGAAEEREGDYFGQPVNRAARISAAGSGGQILLSLAAGELARDSLPIGCSIRDLGLKRLKDLAAAERLFQLDQDGFPGDFPPLKTLDACPNNLPRTITAFFGRQDEVERVCNLLNTASLVTVTGPGGTGKTRLSLECGAALVDRNRDGVWFVDLSRISDPDMIPQEVARAIGLPETSALPVTEALRNRLRDLEALVILDNCEHLVDACAAWVGGILATARKLRILATSREPLLIDGETTFRLAPLPSPLAASRNTPDSLSQFEAVKLLLDRARASGRPLVVDAGTAPLIAGICERLEGMPLAIELAAAQLRFLSLADLYQALGDAFGTLHSRARGASARQATLRGLVDWSWDLLAEEERRAWRKLSVLRGGFTLETAETFLGLGSRQAIEGLSLKSIMSIESGEVGRTRYRMLETMREYGIARLEEAGESGEASRALVDWLLGLSRKTEPELFVLRDPDIFRRLEEEGSNIIAGLETAIAAGCEAEVAEILFNLRFFLFSGRGTLGAAVSLIDRCMPGPDRLDDRREAMLGVARMMRKTLLIWYDSEEASAIVTRTCEAAMRSGDELLQAKAWLSRAQHLYNDERYPEAFRASLDILSSLPSSMAGRVEAEAAMVAGSTLLDAAKTNARIAPRSLLREGEDLPYGLGAIVPTDDSFESALSFAYEFIMRGIQAAEKCGDLTLQLQGYQANRFVMEGDYEEARTSLLAELETKSLIGDMSDIGLRYIALVMINCMLGDRTSAQAWADRCAAYTKTTGVPFIEYRGEDTRLDILLCFREWEQAEPLARRLVETCAGSKWVMRTFRRLGAVLLERGNFQEARETLDRYLAWPGISDRIFHDDAVTSSCAARWWTHVRLGGDAREGAKAAGAILAFLSKFPRLPGRHRSPPLASWPIPGGFGFRDLAELNWSDSASEAHIYEGFLRETVASLEAPLFLSCLLEGKALGRDALWPIPAEQGR